MERGKMTLVHPCRVQLELKATEGANELFQPNCFAQRKQTLLGPAQQHSFSPAVGKEAAGTDV